MATDELVKTTTGIAHHGGGRLPSVDIDSFNIELKDEDGFLGDRASKGAFREILDRWRKPLRKTGEDPFGKEPSESISKKVLDAMLVGGAINYATYTLVLHLLPPSAWAPAAGVAAGSLAGMLSNFVTAKRFVFR